MNKIEFPRTSYDGSKLYQEALKDWFLKNVNVRKNKIKYNMSKRLEDLAANLDKKEEKDILDCITRHLDDLLIASPEKLLRYTKVVDNRYKGVFAQKNEYGIWKATSFGEKILKAFNYDGYQKNKLKELAEKLNVKTCPYCNMHYTLFAEKEGTKKENKLTKFQFDHFFDKAEYPFLSMSLYNLIPSCAVCNQAKSTSTLDLRFHPYHSAICEQFHFEVENPRLLYSGAKKDKININIINDMNEDKGELSSFIETFHIKNLYSRHKDIAQETFDKAYEDPYYLNPSNFNFLDIKDSEYLQRLWMGTYPSTDDIEKRPMTKFIQDLWNQAKQQQDDL